MNSNNTASQPLSIRRNMLWNTVGSLVYQGCLWLITILVVILAGYDDSGLLAYAMAIGNIYFPLAIYNMRTIQVSDVDGTYSQQNYVAFRLVTIAIASTLMLVYLGVTATTLSVFVVSICWIIFRSDEAFSNVYYGVEQRHMRMDYIGRSQLIRGLLVLAIFSITLHLTQSVPISILSITAACLCITFLYDKKNAERFSRVSPRITREQVLILLKKCLPSTLTIVVFGAVVTVTRQIYEATCGAEALGIYAAIATPTVLINAMVVFLYNPYLGPMAIAWKEGDIRSITLMIVKMFLLIAFLVIAGCFVCVLWGEPLLSSIYGPSIVPYTYLLIPTVFTIACTASMAFLSDILIVFRKFKIALTGNLISLALAIGTSVLFIGRFGMNGINMTIIFAYVAGIALFAIALIILLRKCRQQG